MQLPLKLTQLEFCNRLKAAGFDAASLKAAGFDLASLKAAGFDAASLFEAGFSYDELRNGVFAESEVCASLQPRCFLRMCRRAPAYCSLLFLLRLAN